MIIDCIYKAREIYADFEKIRKIRVGAGQSPHSNAREGRKYDRSFPSQHNGLPGTGSTLGGKQGTKETVGWRKACGCRTEEVRPCVVLDPFVESGTTVATALELGRHGVGIDLSEVYLRENAVPRIEAALFGGKVSGRRRDTVAVRVSAPPAPRRLA